jgi:hypothetical protein
MDSKDAKSISRKDFIVLTFTLVGSAAITASCGSSSGGGGTGGRTRLLSCWSRRVIG